MITVCTHQSQGLRDEQEDRVLSLPASGLAAVADGLGGHEDGAQAAQAAVDTIANGSGVPPSLEVIGHLFSSAHRAVAALGPRCYATNEVGQHKMSCGCRRLPATTLSVLWLDGDKALIGHVGDTRIWRVRRVTNGKAEMLTTDHGGPWGLTRIVGGRSEDAPDLLETDARSGDVFVLVSDGVHLTGDRIAEVLAGGPFEQAAERLVEAGQVEYAKRSPRTDNATAIVIRVEAAP